MISSQDKSSMEKLEGKTSEFNILKIKNEKDINDLNDRVEDLQGEINRLKRCTDSQSKDLKRAMREKEDLEKCLQAIQIQGVEREKEREVEREVEAALLAKATAAATATTTTSRVGKYRRNSDMSSGVSKSYFCPVCLFIRLSVRLSVCLSLHPSVCLSVSLPLHPFVCLCVCLFIRLSVCLSVCLPLHPFGSLSVCLSDCLAD